MDSIGNSAKTLLTSFNNVAQSAVSLYTGFTRLTDSGVYVDRANLMVEKSARTLANAQDALNTAVGKFGIHSDQASKAANDLSIAQDGLKLSQERVKMAVDNQRAAMLQFAVSVIPTTIAAVAGLSQILTALNITTAAGTALKLSDIGALIAHKIASAAAAIAEGIHAAATWVLNAALAVKIGLLTLGIGLVAAATAVTVFMATVTRQAAQSEAEFGQSIADTTGNVEAATPAVQRTTEAINGFVNVAVTAGVATDNLNDSMNTLTAEYENAKKAIDDQITGLELLTIVQIGRDREGQTESERNIQIAESISDLRAKQLALADSYAETTDRIKEKIKVQEEEKYAQDVLANLLDKYNIGIAESSAALADYAASFDVAFGAGKIQDALNVAKKFAAEFSISLDDAVRTLQNFQEEATEATDAFSNLTDTFNLSMATTSLKFSTFADDFEAAFGAGRINEAVAVAQNFAAAFSISLDDAIRTLQDFSEQATDSFSMLSDAAKTYLTGQAQDNVQKFKDCTTGKLDALKKKVESLDIFEAINIAAGRIPTTVTEPEVTAPTTEAADELKKRIQIHWQAFAEGGIVREPTLAMIGESGPEAVIPLEGGGGLGNNITINLTVQGSVDKRTAEYAANLIERRLKNVLVEPSSVGGSSTHKRIRLRG